MQIRLAMQTHRSGQEQRNASSLRPKEGTIQPLHVLHDSPAFADRKQAYAEIHWDLIISWWPQILTFFPGPLNRKKTQSKLSHLQAPEAFQQSYYLWSFQAQCIRQRRRKNHVKGVSLRSCFISGWMGMNQDVGSLETNTDSWELLSTQMPPHPSSWTGVAC